MIYPYVYFAVVCVLWWLIHPKVAANTTAQRASHSLAPKYEVITRRLAGGG